MPLRLLTTSAALLALLLAGCLAEEQRPDRSQQSSAAGTCSTRCGDYDAAEPCQCDAECAGWGDCCDDYQPLCVGCEHAGGRYAVGDTFAAGDGCNTCMCTEPGTIACTEIRCEVCEHAGSFYLPGESFPAPDGCNTCTCQASGQVHCTATPCRP